MSARAVSLTSVDIDNALAKAHLALAFQPIVSFADKNPIRFEAFIRWDHPGLGQLPPGAFLSYFEQQGRMGELTRYVLKTALSQADATMRETGLSLNLAVSDLTDPSLPDDLAELLEAARWVPRNLTLECPMFDQDVTAAVQADAYFRLAKAGFPLSLELRGRVTPTLAQLSPFPFVEVKAGSPSVLRHVRSSRGGPGLQALSEMLAFAKEKKARIVAVGVEDGQAASALASLGFDAGQGHWFGRPAAAQDGDAPLALTEADAKKDDDDSPTLRAHRAAARRAALRRLKQQQDKTDGYVVAHRDSPRDGLVTVPVPKVPSKTAQQQQSSLLGQISTAPLRPAPRPLPPAEEIFSLSGKATAYSPPVMRGSRRRASLDATQTAPTSRADEQAAAAKAATPPTPAPAPRAATPAAPEPKPRRSNGAVGPIVGDLPANILPRDAKPDDSLEISLRADAVSPADALDEAVAKSPTIGEAVTPDNVSKAPDLSTATAPDGVALGSVADPDVAAVSALLAPVRRRQEDAPLLLRLLRRKYRITHFWPRSFKRAWHRYQQAKAENASARGDEPSGNRIEI